MSPAALPVGVSGDAVRAVSWGWRHSLCAQGRGHAGEQVLQWPDRRERDAEPPPADGDADADLQSGGPQIDVVPQGAVISSSNRFLDAGRAQP